VSRSGPQRSPLSSKAITLEELRRMPRGTPVLLCRRNAESPIFTSMEAVRCLRIVNIWEGPRCIQEGWVVIDPAPKHLRNAVSAVGGLYYPLGWSRSFGDYPGRPRNRMPYSRPFLSKGIAFDPLDLGLISYKDIWADYCLIRTTDM
jgi:hypothetical protein